MNFHRPWTIFALDAEHDAYGMARIAQAHNTCMSELASARAERDNACTALCPHGLDIAAKYENAKRELAAARAEREHFKNCISAREVRAMVDERNKAWSDLADARVLLKQANEMLAEAIVCGPKLRKRIIAALHKGEK